MCGLAVTALVATAALASGGTSISGAPPIRIGVEETTNTQTDATVAGTDGSEKTGCWKDFTYWRLQLTAGDQVSMKGRANGASGFLVGVFPAGTTDANIRTTEAIAQGKVPNSGPLRFTAGSTGTYPVTVGPNCHDGEDGEFVFTVTVEHSAAKARVLAVLDPVARLPLAGVVTAAVRAPNKAPIHDPNLVLKLYGTWKDASGRPGEHLLGTSTAKLGAARFAYRLPSSLRGTVVRLRVGGGGGDYQPATSRTLVVTVG
jgi:hypothetical protein